MKDNTSSSSSSSSSSFIITVLIVLSCIAIVTPLYLAYIQYIQGAIALMQARQELSVQKITNAYQKNEVQIEKYRIEQLRTVLHTNDTVIDYFESIK